MNTETLRRKPRILVSLAAVLKLEGGGYLPCRIINLSLDGAGIKLADKDYERLQLALPTTAILQWSLVPTLGLQDWSVHIARSSNKTLGVRFTRKLMGKKGEKILSRLLHFHLK
jgi:hypothetical protein